ncbi:MAG: hypothetical protein HYY51_03490 [Candidatus Magasanikbacteria bacterium]|nr:hypothetical protein [Candidatus Magasanikbacteria bacterium]
MKNFLRPYILVFVFLALFYFIQEANAEVKLPYYQALSGYGQYAAYDKGGDIYLFDAETKTEKKINTHNSLNGYAGITVLSTGVFWGEGAVGADIYSYDFLTQKTSKLLSTTAIGTMEKKAELRSFRMLSPTFFEYRLLPAGSEDSVYSKNKYYNIANKKIYGQTDFDANTAQGTKTYGDEFEIFRLNAGEPFGAGHIYGFSVVAVDGDELLMFGYGNDNSGTKEGEYIEYRIHNLSNANTLQFGSASQKILYTSFITPNNQFSYTNFIFGLSGDEKNGTESYYRLDRKSPYTSELVTTLIQSSNSGYTQAQAYGADSLVWEKTKGSGIHQWYRVDDKKTCILAKSLPVPPSLRVVTRSHFFWLEGNTIKGQKLVCQGENVSNVQENQNKTAVTKDLIKSSASPAVYYLGADGKRYVFFNADLYFTWYSDFSSVKTISPNELSNIMIGGNVTYRPGTLVKIQTDPRVYAVDRGGVLRWINGEQVAKSIFGLNWAAKIKVVPDFLFTNYRLGDAISSNSDFNSEQAESGSPDINTDKGL